MQHLAAGLRRILGNRLVGLYSGGSLASGDFAQTTSDIDFLVVTEGDLLPVDREPLQLLHREMRLRHPATGPRLEGDYAPRQRLIPEGTSAPVPGCVDGVFIAEVAGVMISADNIANLREDGIALCGPPARDVLPAVHPDQVRAAVHQMLDEDEGDYTTTAAAAASILDICRSLAAIESGRPATKSAGAAWAKARLQDCDPWKAGVIDECMRLRSGAVSADELGPDFGNRAARHPADLVLQGPLGPFEVVANGGQCHERDLTV